MPDWLEVEVLDLLDTFVPFVAVGWWLFVVLMYVGGVGVTTGGVVAATLIFLPGAVALWRVGVAAERAEEKRRRRAVTDRRRDRTGASSR